MMKAWLFTYNKGKKTAKNYNRQKLKLEIRLIKGVYGSPCLKEIPNKGSRKYSSHLTKDFIYVKYL